MNNPNNPAWRDLARAHNADVAHPNDIYIRSHEGHRGYEHLCEATAGGPQGSALTSSTFPLLLDGVLKETEMRFPGVEFKAIQDDVDVYGDPAKILGLDGALEFFLKELKSLDLKPNMKKCQAYTTTPDAFYAVLHDSQSWLRRPFIITDSETRDQVEMAEAKAKDAASAAANMLPEDAIEAMQVAKDHATLAEGLRAAVPEEKRAYGIKGCGAAVGDDAFVEDFLLQQERELCGDQVTGTPGTIAAVTTDLASLNAHCASAAILYSLQSRVDHLLAVHLPSLTRPPFR